MQLAAVVAFLVSWDKGVGCVEADCVTSGTLVELDGWEDSCIACVKEVTAASFSVRISLSWRDPVRAGSASYRQWNVGIHHIKICNNGKHSNGNKKE